MTQDLTASTVVLDTSAILALMLNEPGAEVVRPLAEQSIVSTVNLSELIAKLHDLEFTQADQKLAADTFGKIAVEFDALQSVQAGNLRAQTRQFGLSLGDRCCLALAMVRGGRVMTADRAWARLDLGVDIEVIR